MELIVGGGSVFVMVVLGIGIFAYRDYWVGYQLGRESISSRVFYNSKKDWLLIKKEFLFPKLFWKGHKKGSGVH